MSRVRLPAAALPLLLACGCGNTQVVSVHGTLQLTPMVADFHTVCLNSTSEFDVTLENAGQGLLTIASTAFSNPAFTLLAAFPASVAPQEKAILRIGFTPMTAQDYSAFLTIKTNAPKSGTQQVTLLGTGFNGQSRDFEVSCLCDSGASGLTCGLTGSGHMTVQPCDFLSFDDVVGGTALQRTVTVQNLGCEPLTFTQAILSDTTDSAAQASQYLTWFSFDPSGAVPPPQTLRGGESQDYVVQFSPPAAAEQTPIVQLQLVSDDTTPPLPAGQSAPGTWELGLLANSVAPSMLVTPDILAFFDATMGVTDTKPFTIQNNGEDTLHIGSIALSGSGEFSVTQPASLDIAANSQVSVNVGFTATSGGGATGTVTVTAAGETQKVALVGGSEPDLAVTWFAPGSATAQMAPVDWGTTPIGDTNDPRTVELFNSGTADLAVSQVVTRDITNSQPSTSFSVSDFSPVTIPAGQSSNVTVVFNDDITLRDDSGKLAIYSNNPADAPNGGYETVDLQTTNDAVFKPIPDISVSAEPQACKGLTLDGSGSSDPQGSPLTYQWALTLVPHGSKATLSTTSGSMTSITSPSCQGPDLPGSYVVTLTVGDQYPQNTNTITQAISVQ